MNTGLCLGDWFPEKEDSSSLVLPHYPKAQEEPQDCEVENECSPVPGLTEDSVLEETEAESRQEKNSQHDQPNSDMSRNGSGWAFVRRLLYKLPVCFHHVV